MAGNTKTNTFGSGLVFIPGDIHGLGYWSKHLGGADFDEVKRWRWRLGEAVRSKQLKSLPRKGHKSPVQIAAVDLERWLNEGQDGALSPQELREIQNSTV